MRNLFLLLVLAGGVSLPAAVPPARAADTVPSSDAPDLRAIRADLKAKHYDTALEQLKPLAARYQQPDVYSLMGFALRKTGNRADAMGYYNKALAMNPAHKGALEYQGELFLEIGQKDNAMANLGKLRQLCPVGCEQYDDLKEAIEQAPKGH
jgi:tetratricopeptide (TPR) repeat protein